ncbi:hypothetical protein [Sporosarcina cyprini]|uniref:hypothetical protein n=1 Tax=Sporosarcina cyprini TaxID=2910523 RepID=UPI001EE0661F|nr:hypothetical protein [Sporosarcina cyprini]MCG3086972.1 hypothetical protein [Sporosarcina cyprini]
MNIRLVAVLLMSVLFIAAGCSKEDKGGAVGKADAKQDPSSAVQEDGKTDDEEEQDAEETGVELIQKPENAGDMEIELAGDVILDGKQLTVKGQTNLLEGSKLYVNMNWLEGILIGGNRTALVEADGSFFYETELPEKTKGLITVEVSFEPPTQNTEIMDHYGETGEKMTGPFIRLYDWNDDDANRVEYQKASAQVELFQDDGEKVEASIAPPVWKKPDDYGSTEIRIEPASVKKDERYIYIDGVSNLLEGTRLRGRAMLPGYITSAFISETDVNPDGSFRIVFENPETDSRIKNLDEYEITIETNIGNTSFSTPLETYGEHGENMTGSLIESEGDEKVAQVRIKEKAE